MQTKTRKSRRRGPMSLAVVVMIGALATSIARAATVKASSTPAVTVPCCGPEWKQMDFWLGNWDLSWPSGAGTNRVTKVLGGCVVEENFSGAGARPLHGLSVSTYSPLSKSWKQTWVDDQGSYIDLTGGLVDGEMTLGVDRPGQDGKPVKLRMVFRNVHTDSFDWSWERSTDGGKTWTVQWPIHYAKKRN